MVLFSRVARLPTEGRERKEPLISAIEPECTGQREHRSEPTSKQALRTDTQGYAGRLQISG